MDWRNWILIVALAAAAPVALGQSADEKRMLEDAARALAESRKAIVSLEVEFDYTINGSNTHSIVARDGQKTYIASVDGRGTDQRALPVEMSWDGQVVYIRNFTELRAGALRWEPSQRAPDERICRATFVDAAIFGVQGEGSRKDEITFKSARTVEFDDHQCIELTWDRTFPGVVAYKPVDLKGTLVIVLDTEQGHWPVSAKRTVNGAEKSVYNYELKDIEYAAIDTPRGKVFYPISITEITGEGPPPAMGNILTTTVDRDSLKINQPIDAARFVLKAFPNQTMIDPDGKTTPPADPNWTPRDKDLFPWTEATESNERGRQKFEEQKAKEEAITAEALSTANTDAERARALADLAALEHVTTMDRATPWIAPIGIVVVLVAGILIYRKRNA